MVVVTGAPGHLGNNLVRSLVNKGMKVRCLALPGESLAALRGLSVEVVRGDIRDFSFLCRIFEGAEVVYHLASVISLVPRYSELMEEVNVKGARNVAEACLKSGVRRLVYTSSIHALVEPPYGVVIDETIRCDPSRIRMEYGKSKAKGTLEVLEVAGKGLDAVIVLPTGMIGPYDFKPSETGRMILAFARRNLRVRISGGYDFVDVRDVAEGHILASKKGRTGEKYILSGEWISVDDIIKEVSLATGVPVPRLRIPAELTSLFGFLITLYTRVSHSLPVVNKDALEILNSNALVSSEKAKRELGYRSRPIRETIHDTVRWFRKVGLLPACTRADSCGQNNTA